MNTHIITRVSSVTEYCRLSAGKKCSSSIAIGTLREEKTHHHEAPVAMCNLLNTSVGSRWGNCWLQKQSAHMACNVVKASVNPFHTNVVWMPA